MDGQNFRLPLGKSFWPLLVEERREIERFFRNEEIRRLVTEEEGRDDDADVRMIDAAYWKEGAVPSAISDMRSSSRLDTNRIAADIASWISKRRSSRRRRIPRAGFREIMPAGS
jgi:hypothetical protein